VLLLGCLGAVLLVLPVAAIAARGGLASLPDALRDDGVRTALRLTAITATIAATAAVALGVALALVAERGPAKLRGLAATIGEAPLVIPPVVVGLGLLATFGRDGLLGAALDAANLRVTFSSAAVVLAQLLAAVPLVVVAVRSGLRTLDPAIEQAAAVHGAGPWRRLRLAVLPALGGPILLGAALAWGRAAGEFGATLTFAGSLPGRTRTLPLEIFSTLQEDPDLAAAASLVQLGLALVTLSLARALSRRLDATR
jgi:molybdate transport system permease protein